MYWAFRIGTLDHFLAVFAKLNSLLILGVLVQFNHGEFLLERACPLMLKHCSLLLGASVLVLNLAARVWLLVVVCRSLHLRVVTFTPLIQSVRALLTQTIVVFLYLMADLLDVLARHATVLLNLLAIEQYDMRVSTSVDL